MGSYVTLHPPSPFLLHDQLIGPIPNHLPLRIIISMRNRNADKVEALLKQVSNPLDPQYKSYLSHSDMHNLMKPRSEDIGKVRQWLGTANVHGCELIGYDDTFVCQMRRPQIQQLFHATVNYYQYSGSKQPSVNTQDAIAVPASVAPLIAFVSGMQQYPVTQRARTHVPGDDSSFGPAAIREAYKVTPMGGLSPNNSMAVAEFQSQFFSENDLQAFFRKYIPYAPYHNVSKVVGVNDPSHPGMEATLDIQYIMGVAPKVPVEFWSQASFDFFSDLTIFFNQIKNSPNPPLVFSISYGSQFVYPSEAYRTKLNHDIASLGARGISIIFASGDSGTGCFLCAEYVDSVPATLPYVTSVGATTFQSGTAGSEIAVTAFGSGGGFSKYFPRPDYQKEVVDAYLSNPDVTLPLSEYYNKAGRGNPDVSALGWGYTIINNGQTSTIGGTSASAPTFSAIIALLNDELLHQNKKPLGFLNPFLYEAAKTHKIFTDITVGNNQHGCCLGGFNCAAGWDPVTGLGTPNADVLLSVVRAQKQ